MKSYLKKASFNLTLILLLGLSFSAGAYTSQAGWLPSLPSLQADSPTLNVEVLHEGWTIIQRHFIDREALVDFDPTAMAMKAIADALGDTGHTRYLTLEEANHHAESMRGSFYGIGAYLGVDKEGQPIITSPIRDTPAERAGLRAGDLLLAVDDQDITQATIQEIVSLIKGDKGTKVALTVLHKHGAEPETVVIIRDEIKVPVIEWNFAPGTHIAHIHLRSFGTSATKELTEALQESQAQGATAIIMDVRNNAGGLLEQAVKVTSQFVGQGYILQREDANGRRTPYRAIQGGLAPDIPLVVLANEFSASSAEIFTGAIQDHERGLVVGTTTFGTGTVLTPFTLSDGSELLLGTSQWLTAQGRTIRQQGLEPDIYVELPPETFMVYPRALETLSPAELFTSGDVQLLSALEQLEPCWWQAICHAMTETDEM